jgi:hypothetical protein
MICFLVADEITSSQPRAEEESRVGMWGSGSHYIGKHNVFSTSEQHQKVDTMATTDTTPLISGRIAG